MAWYDILLPWKWFGGGAKKDTLQETSDDTLSQTREIEIKEEPLKKDVRVQSGVDVITPRRTIPGRKQIPVPEYKPLRKQGLKTVQEYESMFEPTVLNRVRVPLTEYSNQIDYKRVYEQLIKKKTPVDRIAGDVLTNADLRDRVMRKRMVCEVRYTTKEGTHYDMQIWGLLPEEVSGGIATLIDRTGTEDSPAYILETMRSSLVMGGKVIQVTMSPVHDSGIEIVSTQVMFSFA